MKIKGLDITFSKIKDYEKDVDLNLNNQLKNASHKIKTYLRNKNQYVYNFVDCDKEEYKYVFYKNGNLAEIYLNGVLANRYKYDEKSRLIREDNRGLNKTILISYDDIGNILLKTEYAFTLEDEFVDKIEYKYCYCKNRLVSCNDEKFEYDELGNPIKYRSETFHWSGHLLKSIGNFIKFKHNSSGMCYEKISITEPLKENVTSYYLSEDKILVQEDENMLYFHYDTEGVTGFTIYSNKIPKDYWYKKNFQCDIIGIYDQSNTLICKYVYDAWGNHRILIKSGENFINIRTCAKYDEMTSNYAYVASINPFRYRCYYYDVELGLYYFNKRYYDPEFCRFINLADNDLYQNNVSGYIYCSNHPVNMTGGGGSNIILWLAKNCNTLQQNMFCY